MRDKRRVHHTHEQGANREDMPMRFLLLFALRLVSSPRC